jgi:DNA-binding beta-propeller fold protein YncE
MKSARIATVAGLALAAALAFAQDGPYKVLKIAKVGGDGGFDYVYADSGGRKLYVPRSGTNPRVSVYNLDTLAPITEITGSGGHGVAVDPKTHHGFASSKPVMMFDTESLKQIKTIDVDGGPDGIFFDPYNSRVWVFSHSKPNATVIDSKDGSIAGTMDLGGAPEQAASDGKGHLWVDLEDKDAIAAVDAKTMKVTATYDISSKAKGPAGLGYDPKHEILFATCHEPAMMVAVSARDGRLIDAFPIGPGTDGGGFNSRTSEAYSSNGGDGTLSIVKSTSPTSFSFLQNVKTMPRAKTMSIDEKTGHIFLIAAEYGPPPASPVDAPAGGGKIAGRGGRAPMIPDSFSIIMVGK